MLDKISIYQLYETNRYNIFRMAPYDQLANSLMSFEYGLELKISLFDEQREEFAYFQLCFYHMKNSLVNSN